MKTIHDTDTLFATISHCGNQSACIRLCGMSSVSSVVSYLRSLGAIPQGLSQLSIRNCSQGWSAVQALYIR